MVLLHSGITKVSVRGRRACTDNEKKEREGTWSTLDQYFLEMQFSTHASKLCLLFYSVSCSPLAADNLGLEKRVDPICRLLSGSVWLLDSSKRSILLSPTRTVVSRTCRVLLQQVRTMVCADMHSTGSSPNRCKATGKPLSGRAQRPTHPPNPPKQPTLTCPRQPFASPS